MAEKHIKKYPNGATLIYYRQNINSATDVTMGFLCGSKCDPKGKEGTAHALEHSMINRPLLGMSETELYDLYRKTTTIQNGFTSGNVIATTFNTPNNNFEKLFEINSEMFLNHKFNENRWRKERKAILQEIYMSLDEMGISSLVANRSADTTNEILGTPYSLNRITTKDLEEYAHKRFITDNMVISVVTSLPYNEVKRVVEENFIYRFPSDSRKKISIKKQSYEIENNLTKVNTPFSNSFDIEFLFRGLDGVEKNDLMTRFEGWYFNDFAGKLHKNLRYHNHLVYTSSFVSVPVLNSNIKAIVIKTNPENANRCIEVVTNILRDLIKNGISEEEFALFKQAMQQERARKTNIKTYESEKLFFDYVYGKKSFVRNFFNKLMDLKLEEVNKYMKDIYGKSDLHVYYQGDMDKAENVQFIKENETLIPTNGYPIWVVSDEQIVRDYLAQTQSKLYSYGEILEMFKYWDEVQLLKLKEQMDAELLTSEVLSKRKPNLNKVPKISQSKIDKAIVDTVYSKINLEKQKEEQLLDLKEQMDAEFLTSEVLTKPKPNLYKVPKISQSKVDKAFAKTLYEKMKSESQKKNEQAEKKTEKVDEQEEIKLLELKH